MRLENPPGSNAAFCQALASRDFRYHAEDLQPEGEPSRYEYKRPSQDGTPELRARVSHHGDLIQFGVSSDGSRKDPFRYAFDNPLPPDKAVEQFNGYMNSLDDRLDGGRKV